MTRPGLLIVGLAAGALSDRVFMAVAVVAAFWMAVALSDAIDTFSLRRRTSIRGTALTAERDTCASGEAPVAPGARSTNTSRRVNTPDSRRH